jgi:hypothetical protein
MAKKIQFQVGDQVRVKQSGGGSGPTLFEITSLSADGLACFVREIRASPLSSGRYREQRWDTSLLVPANPE